MTNVIERENKPAEKAASRPQLGGGASPVYALGMLGALVYYWRRADSSPDHVRAVGKALTWPAFLVHDLLEHLER